MFRGEVAAWVAVDERAPFGSLFLPSGLGSERRIARVLVGAVGGGGLELIAIFVLDLRAVALPDRLSEIIDQLEDSEGLLGRPVGWDLEGCGERQACSGFGHDLALRRFWARSSDRSWASLRR